MEIGIGASIPTYSGGLGILAGDTVRSAADLGLPLVAVTMLYRRKTVQRLGDGGMQEDVYTEWDVERQLTRRDETTVVHVEGREVVVQCWQYDVTGVKGHIVPVFFLDTDLEPNSDWDRTLSHVLYGGDHRYRLAQEVVLGMGGQTLLQSLAPGVERYHMNEGHSSLLTLALLEDERAAAGRSEISEDIVESVRRRCAFTTHTPVRAGHDEFDAGLAESILGSETFSKVQPFAGNTGKMNMTYLALNLSRYVNGVARRHAEVSRRMFDGYQIDSITNGVHTGTWSSEPTRRLFDRHIPGWREDNASLRYANSIPVEEIWSSHQESKQLLMSRLADEPGAPFELEAFTIGFARRATAYKRALLLLEHPARLKKMASTFGTVQIVYAGKAHPRDETGKGLIRRIFELRNEFQGKVKVVYLENYDFDMGRLLTSGVDLWLNTPEAPKEASGTSGMKAALNGVPSLSILDGWWVEGHVEGVTGWAIGERDTPHEGASGRERDVSALYQKLEEVILPLYYQDRERYQEVMRHAIALNGSFFNTERMVEEYARKAYQTYL